MTRNVLLSFTFLLMAFSLSAQVDSLNFYQVSRWKTGIIGGAGIALHQWGLYKQRQAPPVAEGTILQLNPNDVYGFDQAALRQDHEKRRQAAKLSDRALNASLLFPFFLFLDRDIRSDWIDVTLLYVEAQALSNNIYAWSPFGPTFVDRMRPVAYYADIPLLERTDNKTRQSFFSGHTSSVATATFFMAKVYDDYHASNGLKRWIPYGLAVIPPAFVGVYRVKALRHFPSDIIVGGIIGAGSGLLIPHLHKKWQGKAGFSLIYGENAKGLALSLRF